MTYSDFLFNECRRDICGDDERGNATEGDGNTVLAGDTYNTATDTGKGSIGDKDFLIEKEVTTFRGNSHDMGILKNRGTDIGLHLNVWNGQGRIMIVEGYREMVIIERDEGTEGRGTDKGQSLFRGDIGEDQVEQRSKHPFLLAITNHLLPSQGEM